MNLDELKNSHKNVAQIFSVMNTDLLEVAWHRYQTCLTAHLSLKFRKKYESVKYKYIFGSMEVEKMSKIVRKSKLLYAKMSKIQGKSNIKKNTLI